jgi:hypothetical protein
VGDRSRGILGLVGTLSRTNLGQRSHRGCAASLGVRARTFNKDRAPLLAFVHAVLGGAQWLDLARIPQIRQDYPARSPHKSPRSAGALWG